MNGEGSNKKFRNQKAIELINKCITLKDADMARNNEILKKVLDDVLEAMKKTNEFFQDHFQKPQFVGSFYKGTKVGKPEEFDVNLIIKLPVKYESIEFVKTLPGFTKLKLSKDCFTTPKWEKHSKILSKWVDSEGYLNQDEFRQWIESLFQQTEPSLPKNPNYEVQVRKSGPAFTLYVKSRDRDEKLDMSVDLVPVLEFHKQPLLKGDFRELSWYAVPKPMKSGEKTHLNWRMSFYNHEKKMLTRYGDLKPVIRQVKKLRDKENWKLIPSYHIETLFMHYMRDLDKIKEPAKLSGTERFLTILERLKTVLETQRMSNFWDDSHNLIDADKSQLSSIIGRLGKIIKMINKDPVTIAEFVLTDNELADIKEELAAIRDSRNSGVPNDQRHAPIFEPILTNEYFSLLSDTSVAKLITGPAQKVRSPVAEPPKSSASKGKDPGSAEIMALLKMIHKDINDLKDTVDALSTRMSVLERKVDVSMIRPNTQAPLTSNPTIDESASQFSSIHRLMNPCTCLN